LTHAVSASRNGRDEGRGHQRRPATDLRTLPESVQKVKKTKGFLVDGDQLSIEATMPAGCGLFGLGTGH